MPQNQAPKPLGLPSGSIRALLALTIVAVVNYQLLTGLTVSLLLSETLMIILAHYFASRRNSLKIPPELEKQLLSEAALKREPQPLWLPSGSVRVLILGMFGLTILVLLSQGRLGQPETLSTLGLISAYLLGVLVRWLRGRGQAKTSKPCRFCLWMHIKALLVLLACFFVLALSFTGGLPSWLEHVLLAFILFYFGSR